MGPGPEHLPACTGGDADEKCSLRTCWMETANWISWFNVFLFARCIWRLWYLWSNGEDVSWHPEMRFLFLHCFMTPFPLEKSSCGKARKSEICLSELASVFLKAIFLYIQLHTKYCFGLLPCTSAVSALGEPPSPIPTSPWSSRLSEHLALPWLQEGGREHMCLGQNLCSWHHAAQGISVPFLQSYLKAKYFCLRAGASSALCSQPGDVIPCLVLSLDRLLWCTKQGIHYLFLDEALSYLSLLLLPTLSELLSSAAHFLVPTSIPAALGCFCQVLCPPLTHLKSYHAEQAASSGLLKTHGTCLCAAPRLCLMLFHQLRARGREVLSWGNSIGAV